MHSAKMMLNSSILSSITHSDFHNFLFANIDNVSKPKLENFQNKTFRSEYTEHENAMSQRPREKQKRNEKA